MIGNILKTFAATAILVACSSVLPADDMIVVIGAGGTDEYTELFANWANQWKTAAHEAKIEYQEIGRGDESDFEQLRLAIAETNQDDESPLWLVLLGHGTFDRKTAKFNLRGKDVEAKELQTWLQACQRPLILINGFSCSGAFLQPLNAENRVVITATKSGAELNFSRFGGYLADSLSDMQADLDHDDQVSLLEAFLLASSNVTKFYEADDRLVTEHALLEDNHDGKGISADFFKGIRAAATDKGGAALDGARAHRYILKSSENAIQLSAEQSVERDRLETAIEELRARKAKLPEDEYYAELEKLMVKMARLYASQP